MEKVSNVIASLNERGVPYEVSLIYGLPFQTLESFRASVDWCLSRGMPRVRAWPLMLLFVRERADLRAHAACRA